MNDIDPCETVDLKWCKEVLGLSRRTVFRRVAANEFAKPCSPPRKPLQFRKAAVLAKMKETERAA